jgi:general secretion pathway protein H
MSPEASERGFTLLVLLVVMFIIGVIATMATLSIGVATSEKGTEKEIERIEDLLALASEEAVVQGRELGLTFYRREYEFSTYDVEQARWLPLEESGGVFEPRAFPPDAVVDLELEDRLVALADERPKRRPPSDDAKEAAAAKAREAVLGSPDENLPQVFILSSGDITPFELRLRPQIGEPGVTLKVAADGSVTRTRDEI